MTEQTRKILLSELHKLSPSAREAVNELLADYEKHCATFNAEKFLYELTNIPPLPQKDLIEKLNWAIDTLRNSSRWFLADALPHRRVARRYRLRRALQSQQFQPSEKFLRTQAAHTQASHRHLRLKMPRIKFVAFILWLHGRLSTIPKTNPKSITLTALKIIPAFGIWNGRLAMKTLDMPFKII